MHAKKGNPFQLRDKAEIESEKSLWQAFDIGLLDELMNSVINQFMLLKTECKTYFRSK